MIKPLIDIVSVQYDNDVIMSYEDLGDGERRVLISLVTEDKENQVKYKSLIKIYPVSSQVEGVKLFMDMMTLGGDVIANLCKNEVKS